MMTMMMPSSHATDKHRAYKRNAFALGSPRTQAGVKSNHIITQRPIDLPSAGRNMIPDGTAILLPRLSVMLILTANQPIYGIVETKEDHRHRDTPCEKCEYCAYH